MKRPVTAESSESAGPPSAHDFDDVLEKINEAFRVNLLVDVRAQSSAAIRHESQFDDCCTIGEVAGGAPIHSLNVPGSAARKCKYIVYLCDQPHAVAADRGLTRVKSNQVVVADSRDTWQLLLPKSYTLTSIAVDIELMHDTLPKLRPFETGQLALPYQLDRLIADFIRSSVSLSSVTRFPVAAPDIMRSFLGILSLSQLSSQDITEHESGRVIDSRRRWIKEYIDTHFSSPALSVTMIARHFNLSARYVNAIFAAEGSSPGEYLRKRRLMASAAMLRNRRHVDTSVIEVAFACGFNNSSHFSTSFQREFGMSPRDYRMSARQ